jgi:aryl-alcohol dehydrogenase-like predicted oxidoreductase
MMEMQTRQLGKKGPSISALGLGCMGMSEFYGPTDEAESIATIHRALDLGITYLDTADVYGPFTNEVLVGRAIRGKRNQVFLATKFGILRSADPNYRGVSGKPEYVKQSFEASLKRLGVDVVDLYYQHRIDPNVPVEETVGAMAQLAKEGKVRFLGLSEAGPKTIRRAHSVHPITAVQNEYSLWTRGPEDSVLPVCRELGIGFVPYSPLGRGILTGRITKLDDLAKDDFRRTNPRFEEANFKKNLELAHRVSQMAAEKGCAAGQLALAWVLAQGEYIVPIFGTKRRTYLEENIGALDVDVNAEDLKRLDQLFPKDIAAGPRYGEAMMTLISKAP